MRNDSLFETSVGFRYVGSVVFAKMSVVVFEVLFVVFVVISTQTEVSGRVSFLNFFFKRIFFVVLFSRWMHKYEQKVKSFQGETNLFRKRLRVVFALFSGPIDTCCR